MAASPLPVTLGAARILHCAAHAVRLLRPHPGRWLALVFGFVLIIEAVRIVPVVGLMCKLVVAGLLGARMLAVCEEVDRGGPPRWRTLLDLARLPAPAVGVLAAAALLPFGLALLFIALTDGVAAASSLLVGAMQPQPPADLFFRFKTAMFIGAMPFTFMGAAVTLAGLSGWPAVALALAAARRNVAVVVLMVLATMAAEEVLVVLPRLMPGGAGLALGAAWLLVFLAWMLAWTYTLGASSLGRMPARAEWASVPVAP
jgi:hypothetical protein